MSTTAMPTELPDKNKPAPLAYFLGFVFVLFIGILIFYRHRENIQRLLEKRESKFGAKKSAEK